MEQKDQGNLPAYRVACGGTTTNLDQFPSAIYQGERICFCTAACLKAFEADPQRFMAGEIEHPSEE